MAATVLYCGTGNRGKLREFQQAAGGALEIRAFGPLPCPEEGDSFEANAIQKALCYGAALERDLGHEALLFVDDSGLVVDALDGAPGVYSARFAGPDASDADNNRLLLEKLHDIPPAQRTARYVAVIALVRSGRVLQTFRGEVEGVIQDEAQGEGGFGYDPFFFFPPANCTFASLSAAEKWRHSHRGKACRALLEWLAAEFGAAAGA